jgi:erythromycin esterase-like protein
VQIGRKVWAFSSAADPTIVAALIARTGGVVLTEPQPGRVLHDMGRVTASDEFAIWMRDYVAGRWIPVRLLTFAETAGVDAPTRYYGPTVDGLTFSIPHHEENVAHAREMVSTYLHALAASLHRRGVDAQTAAVEAAPLVIELSSDIARRLAA